MTRYLERVDAWSRLLDVKSGFSLDIRTLENGRWAPLIVVFGQYEEFLKEVGESSLENSEVVQEYLVWEEGNSSSLYSSLRAARENARTIREVISLETWEAINEFWIWLGSRAARRLFDVEPGAFYKKLSSQCMTIHGIIYSTMLHEDPFTFMKLGRTVERLGQTARILDVSHHALIDSLPDDETPDTAAQWLEILRSCSAYEPFFKQPENILRGSAIAEFLIFNRTFPRSVLHNLDRARGLLVRLQDSELPSADFTSSWNRLERMRGTILQMSMDEIQGAGLHETLTWIVNDSAVLCNAIREDYFDVSIEAQRSRMRVGYREEMFAGGQEQVQSQA